MNNMLDLILIYTLLAFSFLILLSNFILLLNFIIEIIFDYFKIKHKYLFIIIYIIEGIIVMFLFEMKVK